MSAPVSKFSRLSLEGMPPPTTRARSREAATSASSQRPDEGSSSDLDSDSDSYDVEDDSPVVRSPSKLTYRVEHLSDKTKATVRDVFTDPPKMALQRCRRINNTYAFQMTELVTRSIRIRASENGSPRLSCSCGDDNEGPCEHLLWLLDQVLKQTLYDYRNEKPLTMKPEGYAEEMGDPFQNIASYHLDVLADGLHCHLVDPDADTDDELDSYRVQESRELLSSVYAVPPEDFRPDIFAHPAAGKKVVKRNDLDCTVFRMLLDNHHFFQYFLSLSRGSDPVNDLFRKLSQRVDRVLADLDAHAAAKAPVIATDSAAESPRDVAWAATHILGSVRLINSAIYTRDSPLEAAEAISAARALVHILTAVVGRNTDVGPATAPRVDRNLYLRLVGDRDRDFVLTELNLLPGAASQFLNNLETVLDRIGVHGAPASYVDKFRKLLARLRTSTTGSGLKRQGQGQGTDRGSKRMK